MKSRMMIVSVLAIGCAANVALSQQGVGVQLKDRDRLQTFSATLQKDQTRLQECLPTELKTSIKDMTLARDQYQQQLRDKQKDVAVCTVETRDLLRDQIKDQIKDQTKDREQIRERLLEESDRTYELVCAKCGAIGVHDHTKNHDYCPLCENSQLHMVEMSYAFKLLLDEIKGLGIFPRLIMRDRA